LLWEGSRSEKIGRCTEKRKISLAKKSEGKNRLLEKVRTDLGGRRKEDRPQRSSCRKGTQIGTKIRRRAKKSNMFLQLTRKDHARTGGGYGERNHAGREEKKGLGRVLGGETFEKREKKKREIPEIKKNGDPSPASDKGEILEFSYEAREVVWEESALHHVGRSTSLRGGRLVPSSTSAVGRGLEEDERDDLCQDSCFPGKRDDALTTLGGGKKGEGNSGRLTRALTRIRRQR